MAWNIRFKTKSRRRREGITNYNKRLKLLKSNKTRLVVRISNKAVSTQIVKYKPDGDITLLNARSLELKKYGWNGSLGNAPAAYLTGLLCGKKALQKGIKEAVLDTGLRGNVNGANVFACLKGAIDAGMQIPHEKKGLPNDERILGKYIESFRNVKLNVEETKNKIISGVVK